MKQKMNDPLTDAYSAVLSLETMMRQNPSPESIQSYGRAKWALHVAIKQNLEVLSYYAQGGTDGGKVAKKFLGEGLVEKPPCKNCGGTK